MDLKKLNSATKYPSILTYHELGDRGRLTDKIQVPFTEGKEILVTEKIDGTNGRIVVLPGGSPIYHGTIRKYLVGSREEFLTAQGDLVYGTDYGIVDALTPIAEELPNHPDLIQVFYFEVFGGDLPASKQYTNEKNVSVRLFDEASVPMSTLDMPIEKIASWRDHGGQMFKDEISLQGVLERIGAKGLSLARVPTRDKLTSLPTALDDTYHWLKTYEWSECNLGGGKGRAEGVVVRTADRQTIAKIRLEDYERTLGIKAGATAK